MQPDTITAGGAASILGVSADSVRRYADSGLIPSWRTPGGQRRFRRSDVEALAAEREGGAVVKALPQPADVALEELVIGGILDAGRVAALHLEPGDRIHYFGERAVAETFPAPPLPMIHVRMADGDEFTFGHLATFRRAAAEREGVQS